jgi:hypothetical protein
LSIRKGVNENPEFSEGSLGADGDDPAGGEDFDQLLAVR